MKYFVLVDGFKKIEIPSGTSRAQPFQDVQGEVVCAKQRKECFLREVGEICFSTATSH